VPGWVVRVEKWMAGQEGKDEQRSGKKREQARESTEGERQEGPPAVGKRKGGTVIRTVRPDQTAGSTAHARAYRTVTASDRPQRRHGDAGGKQRPMIGAAGDGGGARRSASGQSHRLLGSPSPVTTLRDVDGRGSLNPWARRTGWQLAGAAGPYGARRRLRETVREVVCPHGLHA